ncbi:PEGA domain-containing protein [bacterium]|nr:PEGA domain-containing protein [bacterium]
MSGRAWRSAAVAVVALAAAGCGGVNRRFVVESNVPTAQVYIDNKPVGAAPAHAPFEYYGYYTIRLVHPDHETLTRRVHVVAPWYAYPPFDFLADVFWPFRVEDVRRYYFELTPIRRPDPGELIQNADALRTRGINLPPSDEPPADDPGPRVLNPPAPQQLPPAATPGPQPAATPGPQPASGPIVPRLTP